MSGGARVDEAWVTARGYRECCGRLVRGRCPVCARVASNGATTAAEGPAQAETRPEAPKPAMAPRNAKKRQPTKTEERYNRECLGGAGRFEGLTVRLQNGHRYTPDYVVVVQNRAIECHEVKGAYRLGSYQRARLAFDQARTELPWFRWVWAELTKDGWRVS